MKNKLKKIFENAVWWSGVVTVGLFLGLSLQFVKAWTEPPAGPPDGNVGAPLNTGANAQWKGVWNDITQMGSLGISGVLEALVVKTDYLQNSSLSTAESGYVLTLDDPATGHTSWKLSTAGAAEPTQGEVGFTSNSTWTAPPGVTAVTVSLIVGGGGGGGGEANACVNEGGFAGQVKTGVNVTVVPGTEYEIITGNGGAGGNSSGSSGAAGGFSSFGIHGQTPLVKANGGAGSGICCGQLYYQDLPNCQFVLDYNPDVGTTGSFLWDGPFKDGKTNGTGYGTGGNAFTPHGCCGGVGSVGHPGFARIEWGW
jgi:hypothetical protein